LSPARIMVIDFQTCTNLFSTGSEGILWYRMHQLRVLTQNDVCSLHCFHREREN
jgi:hypothetical protein